MLAKKRMNRNYLTTRFLICLILAVITAVAYSYVIRAGFTNYDDDVYVTDNAHVMQGLSADSISWAFTTTHGANWHPVTWISHMIDAALYRKSSYGHHLTSLIIHILNVLLLFGLLVMLTGANWRSAAVAAIFAVHPIHVESVAWVAERKDVLCMLFWLLTTIAYVHYARNPRAKRYSLVLLAFALALMSKPMAVSLPLTLILLDYWPLKRVPSRESDEAHGDEGQNRHTLTQLIVEKIPLFVLSLGSCIITYHAQQTGGAVSTLREFSLPVRIDNAVVSYCAYLIKMAWPLRLAVLYPHPGSGISPALAALSAAFLLAVTAVSIRFSRQLPYLKFGWLWYIFTLLPVIGIVQVGVQGMADRYTYIPMVGVWIAIVWAASDLMHKCRPGIRPWIAAVPTIMIVFLLTGLCRTQVGYWHDSESLFRHELATAKDNADSRDNLGLALQDEGKNSEAETQYRRALQLDPNDVAGCDDLAMLLKDEKRLSEAERLLIKALEIQPENPDTLNDLGLVLENEGNIQDAIGRFSTALISDPNNVKAHNNLGMALAYAGRTEEAEKELETAVRLDPSNGEALNNLGLALSQMGRHEDAMQYIRQSIVLKPDYGDAHSNLAIELFTKGDYHGAWTEVKLAEKYKSPPDPGFLKALAAKMPEPMSVR